MISARTRARMVERLRSQGIQNELVLAAMNKVPRHLFVEEALASRAYDDCALPIGFGQTLSHPYTVARFLSLAMPATGEKLGSVLDVGSGCGYQSVVLAELAREVYAIERISGLVDRSRKMFRELKLEGRIKVRYGDGALGWLMMAPFDAIILAAASTEVPEPLKQQLKIGGRLLIPFVDSVTRQQTLRLIERSPQGFYEQRLDAVNFVPFLSGIR
ncbi:MAG: protein-L-isoaspartate(D-aspartate) O-methyltransferase [Pseudomonadota bacterium]